MQRDELNDPMVSVAAAVRRACLEAGRAGFEDAGFRGLCLEGRIEAAFAAIERLDLTEIVARAGEGGESQQPGR